MCGVDSGQRGRATLEPDGGGHRLSAGLRPAFSRKRESLARWTLGSDLALWFWYGACSPTFPFLGAPKGLIE